MSAASILIVLGDVAPEVADVASDKKLRFVERAMGHVNEDLAGDKYDEAVAYLAAHRLIVADPDLLANARIVLSERTSKTAYTYAGIVTTGPNCLTPQGQQFDTIMASLMPFGGMVLS